MGEYQGLVAAHMKWVFCKAAFDARLLLSLAALLWICRTHRAVSAVYNPAGCLCMVMFKAAHEKEWKLLEVFILLRRKKISSFWGCCISAIFPGCSTVSIIRLSLDVRRRGRAVSPASCQFWASVLQGQRVRPQPDCHDIIFYARWDAAGNIQRSTRQRVSVPGHSSTAQPAQSHQQEWVAAAASLLSWVSSTLFKYKYN